MPKKLLQRVPQHHTIERFRQAAIQRFEEATRSATAGDRLIGIYLAGYSAEMILKAAYFRLSDWGLSDPIDPKKDLRGARDRAMTRGVAWQGNYHDLSAWMRLLVEVRTFKGSAYEPGFARILTSQVTTVQEYWREDLRYQVNRPRPGEVDKTFRAVAWLMANYPSL